MSEGNSIKKDPIENIISSDIIIPIGNNNEVTLINTSDPAESSSHQRASTPRAGALVVVEAYAKVFGGTNQIFAPEKFLYEYIEHLVSCFFIILYSLDRYKILSISLCERLLYRPD